MPTAETFGRRARGRHAHCVRWHCEGRFKSAAELSSKAVASNSLLAKAATASLRAWNQVEADAEAIVAVAASVS
jgi:hypothetical protein